MNRNGATSRVLFYVMTVRQAFSVLDLENFVKFDALSKSLPSRLELSRLHQQAGGSNRKGRSCGRSLRRHRLQGCSYHCLGTMSVVPRETCRDMSREPLFARVCYWMERQDLDSPSRCGAIAAWLNFAELLAYRSFRSGDIGHVVGEGKTDVLEERCTFDGTDNRW
jgi:hypothetical protein